MQLFAVLLPLAVLAACSQGGGEVINQCPASLNPSYDDKVFDQCVAACIKCEHGVMTTCATACRLRGAR